MCQVLELTRLFAIWQQSVLVLTHFGKCQHLGWEDLVTECAFQLSAQVYYTFNIDLQHLLWEKNIAAVVRVIEALSVSV